MSSAFDFDRAFEYENGFYATADITRFSKFITHLDLFRRTMDVPGEIVECGVFKGASIYRFSKFRSLLQNEMARGIWGFDVFDRFPEPGKEHEDRRCYEAFIESAGNMSASRESILKNLATSDTDKNIHLIKGDIETTIPHFCEENPEFRISLLNIDVDLYDTTLTCLKFLFPLVAKGGIVLLDDYRSFPGATRAIEEYFSGTNIQPSKLPYSASISWIVKP